MILPLYQTVFNLSIFNNNSGLDMMTSTRRHSGFFREVRLDEMIGLLEDLTTYFAQPPEDEEMSKLIFFPKIYKIFNC